jgi:hypothetical protein
MPIIIPKDSSQNYSVPDNINFHQEIIKKIPFHQFYFIIFFFSSFIFIKLNNNYSIFNIYFSLNLISFQFFISLFLIIFNYFNIFLKYFFKFSLILFIIFISYQFSKINYIISGLQKPKINYQNYY